MHKTFFLFLVLFGAIITVSGCSSSVPDTTIDGTGSLVIDIMPSSGIIDQVASVSGDSITGRVNIEFPPFEKGRFFIITRDRSRQSEFDVFDKNNLEEPLYTISLPHTTTGKYMTWASEKPLFFDNPDIYMIAFFQANDGLDPGNQNPDYIVFRVSFTGSALPIASLGKYMPLDNAIINNHDKKIVWHDFINSEIKVFDITTKKYQVFSYPISDKRMVIRGIYSYKDDIVTFLVDLDEVEMITPHAVVVTADMSSHTIISTIPHTPQYKRSHVIEYKDCHIGGECSLFSVNGGKVIRYTGEVYFTDVINDGTIFFGRRGGDDGHRRFMQGLPMYTFIPVNQVQNNK